MADFEIHEAQNLIRYTEGALPAEERTATEAHLETCASCRDFVSFVRDFNANLRDVKRQTQVAGEPCPDSSLIIALEANELDERTAAQVRAHMLFCDGCLEEFFLLRRLAGEPAEAPASERQPFEKLKGYLLDFGKKYGIGALLGPFKIIAETPAFALRGAAVPDRTSKTIEVTIGGNTYGVELAVSSEGLVSCSVAGFRTPMKTSLTIVIRGEAGEELVSARTDSFGNAKTVLSRARARGGWYVLRFELGDEAQELLLSVSEERAPD
jgi:hypothetical protein